MSDTPTPITDAALIDSGLFGQGHGRSYLVYASDMRFLERENTKLRDKVRLYLSESSCDGRTIRKQMRDELAHLSADGTLSELYVVHEKAKELL